MKIKSSAAKNGEGENFNKTETQEICSIGHGRPSITICDFGLVEIEHENYLQEIMSLLALLRFLPYQLFN